MVISRSCGKSEGWMPRFRIGGIFLKVVETQNAPRQKAMIRAGISQRSIRARGAGVSDMGSAFKEAGDRSRPLLVKGYSMKPSSFRAAFISFTVVSI